MAFNKWTKQMEMKQEAEEAMAVTAAGLSPDLRRDSACSSRSKPSADFFAIQDKINKALQDIDDIYDQKLTEDALLNDIQMGLADMENGDLKVKLISLLNKYQNQQAQVDSMDTERNQVLLDLADWFAMDHMDDAMDSAMSRSEEVNEAKFEFAKLREINTQLTSMKQDEAGFEDLKRERDEMQGSAVKAFKNAKDTARRMEMVQEADGEKEEDQQVGWKHAASEIVDMLAKVRSEGKDHISELEKKLKSLMKDGDNAMRKIKRLENSLAEKKQMEKKWKEESTKQAKERSTLQAQLKKMKKELIKLRKAQGLPQLPSDVAGSTQSVTADSQSQLTETSVHELRSQMETQQKELVALKEKVGQLEQLLEKKDEELSNLEHDKLELLHQMKHAAVRPDTRHLSDQSSHSLGTSPSLIVTSTTAPIATVEKEQPKSPDAPKGICAKCGGDVDAKVPPAPVKQPKPEPLSVKVKEKEKKENQDWLAKERQLIAELEEKKKQMLSLEDRLKKAQQEINQLKTARPPAQASRPTPVKESHPKPAQETRLPVKAKPKPSPYRELPKEKVQKKVHTESKHAVKEAPQEILPQTENKPTTPTKEECIMIDQCIQTDPKLDPLSDWSKVVPQERGWCPPLPPDNWIEFDPTMPTDQRGHSIERTMLKGAQPSEVKQETETASTYLSKQFTRIMEGIIGFKDYIAMIVDRETTNMTKANDKLKSLLSPEELKEIERKAKPSKGRGIQSLEKDFKQLDNMFTSNLQDLGEIEESDLSSEEKAQLSMAVIANKTVMMLADVVERLRDGINEQYHQYECIYATLQKRPSGFKIHLEDMSEDDYPPLKRKRSRSHSTVKDLDREDMLGGPVERGIHGYHLDIPTDLHPHRSHSNILLKESYISGPTDDRSVAANRKLFQVSQATVPKEGRIQLATPKAVQEIKAGFDPFGNFKDIERRKTKPAPLTHSKLKKRQKELLSKKRGTGEHALNSAPTRQKAKKTQRVAAQLSDDFFEGYTVGELEKRAELFGEKTATNEHNRVMETAVDMRTKTEGTNRQRLPKISEPATQPLSKPTETVETKLPKIN